MANNQLRVYIDEAGYTGADLVNREQPVYVLASICLDDDLAQLLVARCFPGVKSRELRHSKLSFKERGRRQILDFIHELASIGDNAAVFVAHKECVLCGVLVDFWIEPDSHAHGYDLYERGANIGLMNLTYLTLRALLHEDGTREMLRRLQVMLRDRTVFSYASFWEAIDDLRRRHPAFDERLFGTFAVANLRLGGLKHLWSLPSHLLDLGDYGLLATASEWRGRTQEPILLIHDRTTTLERNESRWAALLGHDCPPTIRGHDRRTITFPLRASLQLGDSRSHLQLQLADVIAGAMSAVCSRAAGCRPKHPDYVEALLKTPLLAHCIRGGVWPSAAITPEALDTEGPTHGDAAAYISAAMAGAVDRSG